MRLQWGPTWNQNLETEKEQQGSLRFKSYLPGEGVFNKSIEGKLCYVLTELFASALEGKGSCLLRMGKMRKIRT